MIWNISRAGETVYFVSAALELNCTLNFGQGALFVN